MAVAHLREKLAWMRQGKKSAPKQKQQRVKKENPAEVTTENLGANLFQGLPNFSSLDIERRLVADENLEEEQEEENMQVLLDSIGFLNSLQFQASRVNKERLFKKFNHNFPQLIIVDQLYCLANSGSETFIDQTLEKLVTLEKVKLIDLNNESFKFRLAILHEDFDDTVDGTIKDRAVADKFKQLLKDYPNLLQIDNELLKQYGLSATQLIHLGFLTISREGAREIYNLGLPNLGPFLKIVNVGIKFITKICQEYKHDQVLERDLVQKYNQESAIYRRMRGINLTWVLSVMVGSGLLECLGTSVGKMYRLTGKRM